jgi:glutamate-1-semialdehyde 2,1-aminomutase
MSTSTGIKPTNLEGSLSVAIEELRSRYAAENPKSGEEFEAGCLVQPGANTRSVLHYSPYPLTLARGEGSTVWDVDGHAYLDFVGEFTSGVYGHSDPTIAAAIVEALEEGLALGGRNRWEGKLAEAICARFPAVERVRFCNSGTEANLYALGAARAATGRDEIVVMEGGYHGGVLTFGPQENKLNMPFPYHRVRYNDIEHARSTIGGLGQRTAAVIVEPMLGAGGCIPGDEAFLRELRTLTEATGAVLIFDEVMTSRLAPHGIHGALGITPDIVTLGKYLGGGLTFGALGGQADIIDRFDPRRADTLYHAGTFNNNTLTMAAGLAGLTKVFTPEAAVQLNRRGDRMRERLADMAERLAAPIGFDGIGSVIGYRFLDPSAANPAADGANHPMLRELLHLEMLLAGNSYARRGMITLSLPLTDADTDRFVDAFASAIEGHLELINATV